MKIAYYPGCTLRTKAKGLDETARAVANVLGIELAELPAWTCCGAAFPLVTDDIMALVAPTRNLIYASKEGRQLVTLCSFCYNALKRANRVVREDPEKRDKLTNFIEEEYEGGVKVLHLLEVFRDEIGFENLRGRLKRGLDGLKVAPYYGCLLLRPSEEVGLDDPEDPHIFEEFLQALGCEVVNFPYRVECCGSYLAVSPMTTDVVAKRTHSILNSALRNGAEAIATTCPLCHFNLDQKQDEVAAEHREFTKIPVFYFTQLLGLCLEIEEKLHHFEQHFVAPRPLLEGKGLLPGGEQG
jgi:heterodisulfide reductase subunit B